MLTRMLRSIRGQRPSTAHTVEEALGCYRVGAYDQAEALLQALLRQRPTDTSVLTSLALVHVSQSRAADAAALLEKALRVDPSCAAAHSHYAMLHAASGRLEEAIRHYQAACSADPQFAAATGELLHALLRACDWDGAGAQADRLREFIDRAPPRWMESIAPLTALYLKLEPEVCRQVAAYHAALAAHGVEQLPPSAPRAEERPRRLKIAYFSADFRDHAVGRLINGAFALHDRGRFETYAYSFGPRKPSAYATTIASSVDHFLDLAAMPDVEAARTIADAGIDVLLDLMGHTAGTRLGVLARRPAPVQAHFLGYPGTTGAAYVDYFVTDRVATPPEPERHFTEALAYVPDCYQLSDGAEARDLVPDVRARHALPDGAYVYANFSSASRLERETFALWMRILGAVSGSVLWLLAADPIVEKNLGREAASCGIDPGRLVFGRREPNRRAHLSRLACADLALDTLGWYNGHTTSADMLWAGVPVLTATGGTFPTRVAASLVTAAGLPGLALPTREDYLATAIALGRDRERSRALRDSVRAARSIAPYFQTERLVRGLEATYDAMYLEHMRTPAGRVRAGRGHPFET